MALKMNKAGRIGMAIGHYLFQKEHECLEFGKSTLLRNQWFIGLCHSFNNHFR